MPVTTAIATFFLIWWVVLFAVLPWGVRSQHEGGEVVPGTDPGAPTLPRLGRKLIWTTIVSAVIFAAFYAVYVNQLVTIEGLVHRFGMR
jgi:predicted secreted protein